MTAPDADNRPTPGGAPVTAPEADALDAWLESVTATHRRGDHTPRHVERSRDISRRSDRSPNGPIDPGTSLQATAQGFHARLTRAEHDAEPDVPADAIWEKIMASTTIPAARTSHAPRRAADLVSARPSRPSTPSSARRLPAWLAGSHWAVSALMLAAVVIGIVALYGSFASTPGSDDDPATNPNFAAGTPGKTTTPEPDIDRWLADPATIDCERDSAGWVDSSTWQTDRPKPVENYLPFAPASPATGETLADRWWYLNTDCAPTAADPLITGDYGWMPTSPLGIPTDDQIAIAQDISAALPMQGYRTYYIIREPASAATPVTGTGSGSHLVLLPQDVVQLADGRVGGPLRIPIQTHNPTNAITDLTGGLEAAATIFVVFEQVDDQWLLDEQFSVCVGDCEAVWADLATFENYPPRSDEATPAASATPSADASWLRPYTPAECDVQPRALDEAAALMRDPGESVPRQYGPVSPVSEDLALEVAHANRVFQSCNLTGETEEWRAMVSPRLIFEGKGSPNFDTITSRSATYEEFVSNHRELSELLTDPTRDYTVESPQAIPLREGGLPDYSASKIFWPVMLPDDLVMLPDGRIGGPELTLLPANHEEYQQAIEEIRLATPVSLAFEPVIFRIYAQDPTQDGRWVLDETLALCASGCDVFYDQAEEFYQSNLSILPATPTPVAPPDATTSATPDASAYLQPISAEDCSVEQLTIDQYHQVLTQSVETSSATYLPAEPASPALASQAATTARYWLACSEGSSPPRRAPLETTRYTQRTQYGFPWVSHPEMVVENIAVIEELSAQLFNGEVSAAEVSSGDETATVWSTTLLPERMVELPDGRIGGPVLDLAPGSAGETFSNQSFRLVPFVILVEDSNQVGGWLVDETFVLCAGACDSYWSDPVQTLMDFSLVPQELALPASPAATPVTDAFLQPITAEECDVEALSNEEVSAIVASPGEEIERSYAPAGPADAALAQEVAEADRAWQSCFVYGTLGDRAALQSPRLTRDGPGVPPGFETSREQLLARLDLLDASLDLGETIYSGDARDYLIESDVFDDGTPAASQLTDFIRTVPIPEQAVRLADGRIAMPIARLDPPGTYPHPLGDVGDIPSLSIPVHILVQDPTQGGRWVVDETLTVCASDCDLLRARIVEYIDYLDSLVPLPGDATPVATPEARRDRHAT